MKLCYLFYHKKIKRYNFTCHHLECMHVFKMMLFLLTYVCAKMVRMTQYVDIFLKKGDGYEASV